MPSVILVVRPAFAHGTNSTRRAKPIFFSELVAILLIWLVALPPAPAFAGTRKGDKLRNQARIEEQKGNLQKALDLTNEALATDPGDPSYALQAHRIRFEIGVQHVKAGQALRNSGKLPEAAAEFEKATVADPSSDVALQELNRTRQMIDREKSGAKPSGPDTSSLTPAALAKKELQDRTEALLPVPVLKPLNQDLIDIKITARPRQIFETFGPVAGVNVIFDPDYNNQQTINQPVQIDLKRTTVEAALDQICLVTKSFWKPLNANTIFIAFESRPNRQNFTDLVVKVFYLSNMTTPQEMSEILTIIRTVVGAQQIFQYTAQNAVVVRAEADQMALVEKLIADLDKPHPEVVVDLMVMQVSSTYIRNLSAGLANGLNSNLSFTPRASITTPASSSSSSSSSTTTTTTTTSTSTSIPMSRLPNITSSDFSFTNLPGAQFEAMLSDSSTRILQAPQLRAANNMKATINIGSKIPIATGSFQSAVGAVGALPAANTQFSFQDVGVNLEITPIIHDTAEVTLLLTLDVSAVKDRIDVGGVSQPEISQNKLATDIRLREGEVNLIAGLVTDSNQKTYAGIPGLGKIPILGRLFNSESLEKDKEEIVIALVPHIVRNLDLSPANVRGAAAGTANQVKVGYDTTRLTAPSPAPAAPAPSTIVIPAAPPATAPPSADVQPVGAPRISLQPATTNAVLGSTFTMTLYGENVTSLSDVMAQLQFDPKMLRVVNASAGDLSGRGISGAQPEKNIPDDSGRAELRLKRAGAGPVSGSGSLFTVVFQAMGRGNTSVTTNQLSMLGPSGPIPVSTPASVPVSIR